MITLFNKSHNSDTAFVCISKLVRNSIDFVFGGDSIPPKVITAVFFVFIEFISPTCSADDPR